MVLIYDILYKRNDITKRISNSIAIVRFDMTFITIGPNPMVTLTPDPIVIIPDSINIISDPMFLLVQK